WGGGARGGGGNDATPEVSPTSPCPSPPPGGDKEVPARCTRASANRPLTATQSSTCVATTAAPRPSSDGPIRRATTQVEMNENRPEAPASSPDQNTCRRDSGLMTTRTNPAAAPPPP